MERTATNEDTLQQLREMGLLLPVQDQPDGRQVSERGRANGRPSAEGSELSNTDPSIPKLGEGGETGGVDWLTLRMSGKWAEGRREPVCKVLEAAKEDIRNGGDGIFHLAENVPAKMRLGHQGSATTYCGFVFEVDGCTFSVGDKVDDQGGDCSTIAWFTATSLPCMVNGMRGLENLRSYVFEKLGIEIASEHCSRVDVCVDLPGVGMEELSSAMTGEKYVSPSRKWNVRGEGSSVQTLEIGVRSNPIYARIYDKIACDRHNDEKMEVMRKARWNGEQPDQAIRVEFELKREFLMNKSIDTYADLKASIGSLTSYLCKGWLRFCSEKKDRKHPDRTPTSHLWLDVQERFAQWSKMSWRKIRPKLKPKPAIKKLLDQVRGCMTSIIARLGDVQDEQEKQTILDYVFCRVDGSADFVGEVKRKRTEFTARGKTISDLCDFDSTYERYEREAIMFESRLAEMTFVANDWEPEARNEHDLPAWVETWE